MMNFKLRLEENAFNDFYEKQLNYSLRPTVTLKIQTRQKFLEKDVILNADKRLFENGCYRS